MKKQNPIFRAGLCVLLLSFLFCLQGQAVVVVAPGKLISRWAAENNANDKQSVNNGAWVGSPSYGAGIVGHAFSFNGIDQSVQIPNAASLNPQGSFSIEGWIFPRVDQDGVIISKWGDEEDFFNSRSYVVEVLPGKGLRFGISDYDNQWNGELHLFDVLNVLTINAWNHVAATYDQTTGTRRMYVNGVKVAERMDAPITVLNTVAPVSIGANLYVPGAMRGYFNGLIDELSLYGKMLSDVEVQSIYHADSEGAFGAGPIILRQPDNLSVNYGAKVNFSVQAGGNAPLKYQWRFNGRNISGATQSSFTINYANIIFAGRYSVMISNPFGSVVSDNVILTVRPLSPPVIVMQPTDQFRYTFSLAPVVFAIEVRGSEPMQYQWFFNGQKIVGATGAALVLKGTNARPGYYSAMVKNNLGYAMSTRARLDVYSYAPPPGGIVISTLVAPSTGPGPGAQ
jgi:Concanavalin A-like lectin/glucanases superfamily